MGSKDWTDQLRRGDLEAFNALVSEHQDAVYRLAFYLLCSDGAATHLTESVFQRAFREASSFRGGSVRNWLFSLVVRQYLTVAVSRKERPTRPLPGQNMVASERLVQTTLAALPPEQRLALALIDVEGLDYPQAASIAGWPVSTVGSRLAQARQNFASTMSQ